MKVPYLSASRLKLFKDCPQHYLYKYDPTDADTLTIRWREEHPSNMQAAKLGTNIHNALEEWRRPNPETGRVRRPIYKKLLALYEIENAKNPVDFSFYEDGIAMIERWFYDRSAGNPQFKILQVEQSFGSHRAPHKLSNGVPVFGFIDLVVEHKNGTIELIDYKSQRAPMHQTEADSNIQAGIYLAVARELWPDRELMFSFDLLRYGVRTTVWSDAKIESFKNWLKAQYEAIQDTEKPTATIGDGCKWCSFVDLCPKAQDLIQNGSWDLVVGDDPTSLDQDEMLTSLAKIKAAKSILNKKQQQIELNIKNDWFDMQTSDEPINTESWSVSYQDKERREYVKTEVQKLVPDSAFGQMTSLSNSSVERVLPILSDEVAEKVRRTAIMKPYRRLTVRRKGGLEGVKE